MKITRNVFTRQDQDKLVEFLSSNKGSRDGNELFKRFVDSTENLSHPWQSWRAHYRSNRDVYEAQIEKKRKEMRRSSSLRTIKAEEGLLSPSEVVRVIINNQNLRQDNHEDQQSVCLQSTSKESIVKMTADEEEDIIKFLSKHRHRGTITPTLQIFEDYSKLMPSHSASQYLNYYNTHQKRLLLANVQSQKAPELKSPTAPDVDSEDDLLATGSDPISVLIESPSHRSMPRVDDQDGYSWIQGSLSVSTGSSDELEIEDLIFGDKNSSSNPLTPLERDSISRLVDIFTDRSDEEPNDTDIPSEGVRRSIRNQRHQVDHEDLGSSLDVSREESVTVPDRDRRLGDECEASTTCPASTDSIVHPPSEVEPRNCHTSVSATKAVPHQDLRHRTPDHHNTTGRSSSNRRSTTAQPTGTAPLTSTPLNSINSTRNFQPPDKGEALSESSSRLRTESAVYSAPRKRFSLGGSGVQRRSLSNLTSRTSSSFKPAKDPTNAKEAIELVKIFLKEFPNQYSDQEALKLFKQCGGWSLMFEVASLRVLNNESDEGDRRYSEKVRSMIWTEEEDRLVLKLVEKIRSRRLEKKEGDRDSIKETVVEDDSESFSSADPGLIEELKLRKSEQAIKNRIEFLDNYLKHSNLF